MPQASGLGVTSALHARIIDPEQTCSEPSTNFGPSGIPSSWMLILSRIKGMWQGKPFTDESANDHGPLCMYMACHENEAFDIARLWLYFLCCYC